jgi:CRP-like cAMP-binding protein
MQPGDLQSFTELSITITKTQGRAENKIPSLLPGPEILLKPRGFPPPSSRTAGPVRNCSGSIPFLTWNGYLDKTSNSATLKLNPVALCPIAHRFLPSTSTMSKANQQKDILVLSSAKNGLVHLTANDWALIADKAERIEFDAGTHIVHRGRPTHGVYLIVTGTASVEIPSQLTSRQIGPGEACGEISLIDELPATADVIAKEAVEAYYLDKPTLQSMFELFPHLGSRFYRSLASILSRRLREVIARPVAMKKESAPANLP